MVSNVCLHGSHHHLRLRVLTDELHEHRVLHGRHVHLNVGLMILVQKGFDRLAAQHSHVLRHGVGGLHVVGQRD